jgi:Bax protein
MEWARVRASVVTGSGLAFAGVVAALSYQSQPVPAARPPVHEVVIDIPSGMPSDTPPIVMVSGAERAILLTGRVSAAVVWESYGTSRLALDRVPRVVLAQLPSDIHTLQSLDQRRELFIATLLPILLTAGERIEGHRARLQDLVQRAEAGETLGESDQAWLARLAREYKLDRVDFDELLLRVDIIPLSLALAQAAIESGWGSSAGARQTQSLFGHMTNVVREGADGPDLRRFATLTEAVVAYIDNLNTNRAYARFRATRAAMRRNGGELDADVLLGHLVRYSERGADYIRGVRTLIRTNDLRAFDGARFAN